MYMYACQIADVTSGVEDCCNGLADARLDRERMAIEIVFRLHAGQDDYLFWITVKGAVSSPAAQGSLTVSAMARHGEVVRIHREPVTLTDPRGQAVE
jgi:hypothetical protein